MFSYHYKYEKYLRDNNLIDPDKARLNELKAKRKLQQAQDKQPLPGNQNDPFQGEDLEGDNDDSYPGHMNGKHRFDQLIKTMIARIEYNNTLAPVQEYGRHQTKALKKRKGKVENDQAQLPKKKGGKKDYDDRFYDLDDNFIDDGDIEDQYGANGLHDQMMNDDFFNDEHTSFTGNGEKSSINVSYDPKADNEK